MQLCKEQSYLPTIEGLAVHLMAARSSIYLWAEQHSEFSDILEQLVAAQPSQLLQNGLVGDYNPTITKLMLSKHDGPDGKPCRDKTEVDHTTDGKPLPAPIIVMRIIDDAKGDTAQRN